MNPMLNIAVRAARAAGKVIVNGFERRDNLEVDLKGANDFVTNIDKEAEQAIIETIKKNYPDHTIIGEENGPQIGENNNVQWVIDPLDGTTNFVNGFPHFAVSIAVRENGRTEVAVVYDPLRNELFTAIRGAGARLNDTRLRVASRVDLANSIIATGFPYRTKHAMPIQLAIMSSMSQTCPDFRRTGSAALDLCYVAAKRVDGFFEIGLKPWDIAAGELIVREAGGLVTDFAAGHNYLKSGNIVAGPSLLVRQLLSKIKPQLTADLAE